MRPMGPFIATLEATQSVTISLVLPMVGHLLKALNPASKVLLNDYEDPSRGCLPIKINVSASVSISSTSHDAPHSHVPQLC